MSKRKWHHPEVPNEDLNTKVWRSAGELEDSSTLRQWVDKEFPRAAETMRDEDDRENTRRDFLKLMGASTALAGFGLAACRRPEMFIVPMDDSVEWSIPGKFTYYTTAMPSATGATPLAVATSEGRPTKLEPNKLFPGASGTDAMVQASILNMYEPSRSRHYLAKGKGITKAKAEAKLAEFTASGNVGFVFGEDDSLTRTELVSQLKTRFAGAKFYSYEALAGAGRRASNDEIFGKNTSVKVDFTKAKRILSLDCDFLELDKQGDTKGFYDRRRPEGADYNQDPVAYAKELNRLYVVEPTYSVTGGVADHRAPLAPSQIAAFIKDFAAVLDGGSPATILGEKAAWIQQCAKDLNSGGGVIVLGSRYGKELHDAVHALNTKIGAYAAGVVKARSTKKSADLGSFADLGKDIASLETVILMTPSNPFHENPMLGNTSFKDAVADKKVIHWGEQVNASANAADLHIPAAHYLESWGDTFAGDEGLYTIVQPAILPLYGGIQELELLVALTKNKIVLHDSLADENTPSPAYEAVRATFEKLVKASSDKFQKDTNWKELLRTGYSDALKYADAGSGSSKASALSLIPVPAKAQNADVVFSTDYSVLDGRYINNSWLQEAPDPISKLTWDNAIYMSPQTAKELDLYDEIVELEKESAAWWANLGIDTGSKYKTSEISEDGEGPSLFGPMVKVSIGDKSVEAVVIVAFGMADNVISLPLGYGQGYDEYWKDDFKGGDVEYKINTNDVSSVGVNRGFDGYPLRGSEDYYVAGNKVSIEKVADKRYKLARTQEHHSMYGRALAREVSTMPAEKAGGFVQDYAAQLKNVAKQGMDSHAPQNISLYKFEGNAKDKNGNKIDREHLWDKSHQWAMSIDLSTCTGCNACLIACQAENNIPVVGKNQVAMGREMHWIRMDRYFAEPGKVGHDYDNDGPANPSKDWNTPLEMIPNPVACVQCESAPCETVCPVNATVHTEDGLNSMAYNRCIGTRYCANNCPYKARRFNFFDYNKRNPLLHKNLYKGPFGEKQVADGKHLQRNPNVSVRMRGVMEKCTYCVQRLNDAKIKAKQNLKKEVQKSGKPSTAFKAEDSAALHRAPANSVSVACQDACSAGAIVFGNILNKEDLIYKTKAIKEKDLEKNVQGSYVNPRTYDLLNYIGTRPRTSYMARVKNPNPAMAAAAKVGKATIHMH